MRYYSKLFFKQTLINSDFEVKAMVPSLNNFSVSLEKQLTEKSFPGVITEKNKKKKNKDYKKKNY
jgi:hypothetical protein